ncbi:hypothetical protein [Algivirga pacifica]|uniref:Uncharacterized protein n=1 Tax=Algivirga pacifica TaxID=1162670 RepID=A0ABP9D3I8_9BACT
MSFDKERIGVGRFLTYLNMEEGGRRKEEGGRRKEEGGRRKEEGGRRKEEGINNFWRIILIFHPLSFFLQPFENSTSL